MCISLLSVAGGVSDNQVYALDILYLMAANCRPIQVAPSPS
jgi:hypothetical protein